MEAHCMYLRKSRADLEAEQAGQGETLARHEHALRRLAEHHGIAVSAVYREIVSGDSIAGRPVMRQLLREVEAGRWDGVLVMEVERLARGDTVDQGVLARAFKYSGAKIYTPVKVYDPMNEFDEEYFEFGLFMSRREYKAINRRLQRGRQQSALEGKFTGSRAPYGYDRAKIAGGKGFTLVPNGDRAAVEAIFSWYVHGVGGRRMGVCGIAGRLNDLGIPSATGRTWLPSTVRDVLGNPVYAGFIRWNWRPVVREMDRGLAVERRPRRVDCQLLPGLHPALVDEALWREAQALLEANRVAKSPRGRAVQNPLSGLVVCGRCGRRMVRKAYRHSGDLLVCPTRGCGTASALLGKVEARVLAGVCAWMEGCVIRPHREDRSRQGSGEELLRQAEGERTRLERQRERLYDLLERGLYDEGTFRERMERIGERIARQEELIGDIRAASAEQQLPKELPEAVSILELYVAAGTPEGRNRVLKELLERVEYSRERGGRWHGEPFSLTLFPRFPSLPG